MVAAVIVSGMLLAPGLPAKQAPAAAAAQPARPAPPPPGTAAEDPGEATLGVPIYPSAQFITSYDAGRGQRFYLFGTTASFVELVTYYRTLLRQRGELVYETPATHQFDIGRFDGDRMAFPPSITIKDFQSEISEGYPNPKPGGEPARYRTVIQVVPATAP